MTEIDPKFGKPVLDDEGYARYPGKDTGGPWKSLPPQIGQAGILDWVMKQPNVLIRHREEAGDKIDLIPYLKLKANADNSIKNLMVDDQRINLKGAVWHAQPNTAKCRLVCDEWWALDGAPYTVEVEKTRTVTHKQWSTHTFLAGVSATLATEVGGSFGPVSATVSASLSAKAEYEHLTGRESLEAVSETLKAGYTYVTWDQMTSFSIIPEEKLGTSIYVQAVIQTTVEPITKLDVGFLLNSEESCHWAVRTVDSKAPRVIG